MERNNNELERQTINGLLQRRSNKGIREVQRRHSRNTNRNNSSQQEINESLTRKLSNAYLAGVLYGDGTVNVKHQRHKNGRIYEGYRVKLSATDKEFIELYVQTLTNLGLSCRISIEKRRQENYKDIISAVSQDKGTYNYVMKIKSLSYIHKMSKPELVIFLKALFDSDGSIGQRGTTLSLAKSPGHPATPLIKIALDKIGIKYSYYIHGLRRGRVIHEGSFGIFGDEACKLYDLFGGFSIKRKDDAFKLRRSSIKQKQWTDEHTLLLYDLRKKGLNYELISKKLNRTKTSIAHKLNRLGLTKKIKRGEKHDSD